MERYYEIVLHFFKVVYQKKMILSQFYQVNRQIRACQSDATPFSFDCKGNFVLE